MMPTSSMSSRERLTAAVRRQPVDRPPWTVDLAYYNSALCEQGQFPKRFEGLGILDQCEELGVDPYFCYECFPPCSTVFRDGAISVQRQGLEEITTYSVGRKRLVGVKRYVPESFSWAPCKYPVESVEDMGVLCRLMSG